MQTKFWKFWEGVSMEQLGFVDILEDEKIIEQLGGRQMVANDWDWELSDLQKVKKNNLKVFSCFACGGGRASVISWLDMM